MPKGQYTRVKVVCDKCKKEISNSVFSRHFNVCTGPKPQKRKFQRVLSLEEELEISERYERGTGYRQIEKDFKIGSDRIIKILNSHGVKPRNRFEAIQKLSRENHSCWNGGITKKVSSSGRTERFLRLWEEDPFYVMIDSSGYVREHRLIMARHIGRPLTDRETVHHIDGDTLNNDISNLQLRSKAHGVGQIRVCGECGSNNIVSIPLPEEKR